MEILKELQGPALRRSALSLESQISQTTARLCAVAFPVGLRAIILTGSLARGEGTWVQNGITTRAAGDAEFLLVFESSVRTPSSETIAALASAISARLASSGIVVHVALSAVRPHFLRRLQPHIFAYELRTFGKIIWGDPEVLRLISAFSPADIPLDDAFHLLINRMIELLEVLCANDDRTDLSEVIAYKATKFTLDMATSYLLFAGSYLPSYRARAATLAKLSATPQSGPWPLQPFAERVSLATCQKMGEVPITIPMKSTTILFLIQYAHALWRWELEKLSDAPPATTDGVLFRLWGARQPILSNLRGWGSLARRCELVHVIQHALQWTRYFRRASPRRLIYGAASELFFALPTLLYGAGQPMADHVRWQQLQRCLPVSEDVRSSSWRSLGLAISLNYHRFLESTRS